MFLVVSVVFKIVLAVITPNHAEGRKRYIVTCYMLH